MSMKYQKLLTIFLLSASIILSGAGSSMAVEKDKSKPIIIQEQGSFAVGGTIINNPGVFNSYKMTPEGQTFHGDHAYV